MSMSKRKSCDLSESESMEFVESNSNNGGIRRAKNVMVSFSKRRQGLFRKASELCTRFDSRIAILVLSSSGNPFSFGHSSVDEVLRRYDNILPLTAAEIFGGEERAAAMRERQRRQEREIEALKARVKEKERAGSRRSSSLMSLVDDDSVETNSESVEELESLKVECLALLTMVREKLRNDMSFFASGSGDHHKNSNKNNVECNNQAYDQVVGSLEKNDIPSTAGSTGDSNTTFVEADDFFNFADQICTDRIGSGDENNDFGRRFLENFDQFQDICGTGNEFDYQSVLTIGQQNDMPFWVSKSCESGHGGLGSTMTTTVDGSGDSSFFLTCNNTTWC